MIKRGLPPLDAADQITDITIQTTCRPETGIGSMSFIQKLPVELLLWIMRYLDLVDIMNLGMTCFQLWAFVNDGAIARSLLRMRAPFSKEFASTTSPEQCPSVLRTMLKRQAATSRADPFAVAVVAKANSFILSNGLLAYTTGTQLRMLPIYNPRGLESVIDIAALFNNAAQQQLKLTPVHYSHEILSCVRKSEVNSKPSHHLVVIDVRRREVLCKRPIDSVRLLFVRNSSNFLVYGSQSEYATGGQFMRWVMWVLDLRTLCWKAQRRILPDLVGSSPGASIDFEIVDDHLLALSNTTCHETTARSSICSSYYAVRFPLEDPCLGNVQETSRRDMYRRKNLGGHIDDRWNLLKIGRDVVTGKWLVREVRKEWVHKTSEQWRGLWEREIAFPSTTYDDGGGGGDGDDGDGDGDDDDDGLAETTMTTTARPSLNGIPAHDIYPSVGSLDALIEYPYFHQRSRERQLFPQDDGDNDGDNDDLVQFPKGIHFSSDADSVNPATGLPYPFTDIRFHAYAAESQTFLDLINDGRTPDDKDRCPPAELRIRAISAGPRRVCPLPADQSSSSSNNNNVSYWPQRDGTFASEQFLRLLNPQSKHAQSLDTAFDESSSTVVYGPADQSCGKRPGRPRHLVLVSFDPSVRLAGLPKWGPGTAAGGGRLSHAKKRAPSAFGWNDDSVKLPSREWVSVEKAMYLTIARDRNETEGTTYGYDFTA